MNNDEKAKAIAGKRKACYEPYYAPEGWVETSELECYDSAMDMADWKDKEYGELINKLIDELNTAKFYLVGANGLMSKNEIDDCFAKNDCALIRGINRTIRFVNNTIFEMKGVE